MNHDEARTRADRVVAECELPEPPEKVWRALTTPELLSRWLMPNDIRPQVGSCFRFEPRREPAAQSNASADANPDAKMEASRPRVHSNEPVAPARGPVAGARGPVQAARGFIECEVLASEPGRLLRYSWRGPADERDAHGCPLDSIVTFELTPTEDGGTHLRVLHEGLAPRAMRQASGSSSAEGMRGTQADSTRDAVTGEPRSRPYAGARRAQRGATRVLALRPARVIRLRRARAAHSHRARFVTSNPIAQSHLRRVA